MGNKTPSDPFDPTQPFDPEHAPGVVPDFDEGTAGLDVFEISYTNFVFHY